jgi:hypothetical protein
MANRVLKPDGTLAVWGYAGPSLYADHVLHEEGSTVVRNFFFGVLGPFWDDRRRLVDAQYEGLEPASDLFARVTRYERITRSSRCLMRLCFTKTSSHTRETDEIA